MKKKLYLLVLIISALAFLSGCQKKTDAADSGDKAAAEQIEKFKDYFTSTPVIEIYEVAAQS